MKLKSLNLSLAIAAAAVAMTAAPAHAASKTVDAMKARGELVCGVNTGLAGFSQADSSGNWSGLDVDYCKAVAAAVLGDANKVKYVPLNAQQRFTALQSGEIDVLKNEDKDKDGKKDKARDSDQESDAQSKFVGDKSGSSSKAAPQQAYLLASSTNQRTARK